MTTERGLAALRIAATLATSLPPVRVQLRHRECVLVDVRRPPFPRSLDGRVTIPPCAFRRAVIDAADRTARGEDLTFLDLDQDEDPAIDIGLPVGDRTLGGGIYRVRRDDEWLHVFGTCLDLDACADAVADGVDQYDLPDSGPPDGAIRVGFHWDEGTRVTLVHTACVAGEAAASEHHAELLRTLLGRCATHELIASLV
jgi:hypothetical protein